MSSKKANAAAKQEEKEHQTKSAPRRQPGTIEDFPILRYGANNNYAKFMDDCAAYCGRQFGNLARIFDDLSKDYWEPPVIKPPAADAFSTENDPTGVTKLLFLESNKSRLREISDMANKRPLLFEVVRANLSTESKHKIEEAANWDKIHQERCPLKLLRRIKETHAAGEIRTLVVSLQIAKNKWSAMRQNSGVESIATYLKRFQQAIDAIASLDDAETPTDQEQAVQFALSLDSRWAQFRVDMENNARTIPGFTYPDKLINMYDMAANYQVVTPSGAAVNAAAFPVQAAKKKQEQPAAKASNTVEETKESKGGSNRGGGGRG